MSEAMSQTHVPVLTLFFKGAPAEYTSSFSSFFIPKSFFVPLQPGTPDMLIPMPFDLLHRLDFLSSESSISLTSSSSTASSSYSTADTSLSEAIPFSPTVAGAALSSSPLTHPPLSPADKDRGLRGSGKGAKRIRG